MHGNVWEWCWDGYAADYYKRSPVDDPPGPDGSPYRMIRGGGWDAGPGLARSANHGWYVPEHRGSSLGFRLVLVRPDRQPAGRPADGAGPRPEPAKRPVVAPPRADGTAQTITNPIGMKLTLIPAGEFQMGSPDADRDAEGDEKPQHRVRITRPFYLGIHEVTRGQFRRFVEETGYQTEGEKDGKGGWHWNEVTRKWEQNANWSWRRAVFEQSDDHPVIHVSWRDAVAFADWLSRKEEKTYRLPTEAEWEYACRAGTTTRYYSGDDPETLASAGNVADATARSMFASFSYAIAARDGFVDTAPVGRFRPNGFGLFDMHGNVWEWCLDRYGDHYDRESPLDDPAGPSSGVHRVVRGGCWQSFPLRYDRSASRGHYEPDNRGDYLGFRLALVPPGR
jgi:formylglycine-generating enzyme required for sulfatase activity